MAKNLQAKLPPADDLSIFDINREAMQRLAGEMKVSQPGGASVVLASSAADASKNAVRIQLSSHEASSSYLVRRKMMILFCSISDLSCSQLAGCPVIISIYKANPLKSRHITWLFQHYLCICDSLANKQPRCRTLPLPRYPSPATSNLSMRLS